ncbi:MAG: hypothetical protein ACLFNO_00980 [Parcubacteria group bacterium]
MNIRANEESTGCEVINEKDFTAVENMKVTKDKEFKLTVDYSRSLEEMIKVCAFDWIDRDIKEKYFPLPVELLGQKVSVCAKLFHFDRFMSSESVIDKINKTDSRFRPATLAEQLAFAESYPELQKSFPIIALGSAWRVTRSSSRVVAIDFDDHGRELGTSRLEGIWQPFCRFLAVSK